MSLDYPDITFVLAHSGMSYAVARGMIEFLVEQVGADKVLYGSDFPMRDPAPQLGWVCYAKIPVEDKKKILAGNIRRLLERGLSS